MEESRSEEFLQPYRAAVARHGASFEATLWGTPEAQHLRFDVMIELAGFEGCRIVDIGCGRGDFAAHLIDRGVGFRGFVGVDALPEMIDAARARDLARSTFVAADVVATPQVLSDLGDDPAPPDFACFSGTLNTMDGASARWLVRAAFDAAAQGVIFNFLSNRHHPRWAERDLAPARRFDTLAWLDWAFGLSSRVSFTQDYLDGHDATILIRHDRATG